MPTRATARPGHSTLMRRDTLLDFFADLAATPGTFLVHDDGFRTRQLDLCAR